MRDFLRAYPTEAKLLAVLVVLCAGLSIASPQFLTLVNITSLLNNNAVNVIWAVGLLVVLIAGLIWRQGPHQGAQKSTRSGRSLRLRWRSKLAASSAIG